MAGTNGFCRVVIEVRHIYADGVDHGSRNEQPAQLSRDLAGRSPSTSRLRGEHGDLSGWDQREAERHE